MGCEISEDDKYRNPRHIFEDTDSDDIIKKYHDKNGVKENKKEIKKKNKAFKKQKSIPNKNNLINLYHTPSSQRSRILMKDSSNNTFSRPNININLNDSNSNVLYNNPNLYKSNKNLNINNNDNYNKYSKEQFYKNDNFFKNSKSTKNLVKIAIPSLKKYQPSEIESIDNLNSNDNEDNNFDSHKSIRKPKGLPFEYKCIQAINAHEYEITCLIYLTKTKEIASSSLDKLIKIWENKNNIRFQLSTILKGHTNSILSLREFSKLNLLCSCSVDQTLKLWDLNTLNCYSTLSSHTKSVLCSTYIYNGNESYIFSGGDDSTLIMWIKDRDKKFIPIRTLDGHNNSIVSLVYINEFNYLCSGSDDKTIRIWDSTKNFLCVKIFDDIYSEIDNLKYARNRLIACCENGTIFFINVTSLKKVRSVQFTKDAIYDINLMDNEKYLLVAGTDCKGRVWEIGTNERELLIGHTKPLSGIISLKNFNVATSSMDGTIRIWKKINKD